MPKHIIHTGEAPEAIGPYSQAVSSHGIIYTSGQIALSPQTGEVVGSDVSAQAEQCFKNLKAVLEAGNADFGTVIKTTVFLSTMDDFAAFNAVYSKYFTDHFPARSCVAVKTLPKNVLVEIEAIAHAHSIREFSRTD